LASLPAFQSRLGNLRAYLRRQRITSDSAHADPHPELGIVVVIPCYDEPDLAPVLESLWRCERPRCAVEILLVVNASERDDDDVRRRNQATIDAVRACWDRRPDPRFRIRTMNFPRLPARYAGVGLARKTGMDDAVAHFLAARNPDGIIASLDADCTCDGDYLVSLESHFHSYPETRACTVYFEHPLSGPHEKNLYQAVISYASYLRYYRHGLQFAGTPYAHYTVGSCFAVRCDAYARHGGMNRRKAGEDFYFLNKLMVAGGVTENNGTRVVPDVRPSTRTPFGTGRALNGRLANPDEPWLTYNPLVFRDLAELVEDIDDYYDIPPGALLDNSSLSDAMKAFLVARGVDGKHEEIVSHSASRASFRKRFFQWFNGFMALKFIHHATESAYPRLPLEEACVTLLEWRGRSLSGVDRPDARALLCTMRDLDRSAGSLLDTGQAVVRLSTG
jgi:hypothetical protein